MKVKELSKTNSSKTQAKQWTADAKLVAEQSHTEDAQHSTSTTNLDGDIHEINRKMLFSEICNDVPDLFQFLIVDDCNIWSSSLLAMDAAIEI